MMIFFGLLVPLVVLLVGALRLCRRRRNDPGCLLLLVVAAFGLASVVFWLGVLRSTKLAETREIAWVGVATLAPEGSLRMGGSGIGKRLDWPSGASAPEVVFSSVDSGGIRLEIPAGEGFLRVPNECLGGSNEVRRTLGGEEIPRGRDPEGSLSLGEPPARFSLFLREPGGLFPQRPRLEVRTVEGLRGFAYEEDLPWYAIRRNLEKWNRNRGFGAPDDRLMAYVRLDGESLARRPRRLVDLIRPRLAELYRRGGDPSELARDLEGWSSELVLSADEGDGPEKYRYLAQHSRAPTETVEVTGDCAGLRAIYTGSTSTWFALERPEGGGVRILFEPPWRRASLLPPGEGPFAREDGSRWISVGPHPQPGDALFALPLRNHPARERSGFLLVEAGEDIQLLGASGEDGAEVDLPWESVLAATRVELGGLEHELAVADLLPSHSGILVIVVLSWLPPLFLLLLLYEPSWRATGTAPVGERTIVAAVMATFLWLVLLFRLALALRHAANPSTLDGLAISGVLSALGALFFGPSVLLLLALSRQEHGGHPGRANGRGIPAEGLRFIFLSFVTAGCLGIALGMSSWIGPGLWADLPRTLPFLGIGRSWSLLMGGVSVALIAVYLLDWISVRRAGPQAARWEWFEYLIREWAPEPWHRLTRSSGRLLLEVVSFVAAVGLAILVIGLFPVGALRSEFVVTFVVLTVAAFWLGSRGINPAIQRYVDFQRSLPWAVGTVLLVAASPVLARDPGAGYAAIGLFLLLGLLLVTTRPRRPGVMALASLVLGLALTAMLIVRWDNVTPLVDKTPFLGYLGDRVIAFREGIPAQQRALDRAPDRAQSLRNAVYHVWGNEALAHSGGWAGSGFGRSPVRRLAIRQDTLQVDSVYSGFVAGDQGVLGGVSLLLLYCGPLLLLILFRPGAHAGYLFALLITGWLAVEALIHAAMNLGMLPFSGRNFPLLAVQSPSDFLRWILLLGLALRALYWEAWRAARSSDRETSAPAYTLGAVLALSVVLVAGRHVAIAGEGGEDLKWFSWQPLLTELENRIQSGELELVFDSGESPETLADCAEGTVRIAGPVAGGSEDSSFLGNEVAAFNALRGEEKLGEGSRVTRDFRSGLLRAGSVEDFWSVLSQLPDNERARSRRPTPFFRIGSEPLPTADQGGGEIRCRLEVNPEAQELATLRVRPRPEDLPRIRIRDAHGAGESRVIVGPAWVMGRWRPAIDSSMEIGWLARLARIAEQDLLTTLDTERFEETFGALTLSREWHDAAQSFVRERGNQLFAKTFAPVRARTSPEPGSVRYRRQLLPPRIALTVIDATDGAVLALGGWPRTTPGSEWVVDEDRPDVLPPASWLAVPGMPRELRSTFLGDRNFDLLPMGSITKPLWAAAALEIHPDIDRRLAVTGPAERSESEIFGVDLGQSWSVGNSRSLRWGPWADFRSFLARSDNRYAIRLGFLGLAETIEGDVLAERSVSPAGYQVSMDGGRTQWNRFPRFPDSLGFSSTSTRVLRDLHEAPLLEEMWRMFRLEPSRELDPARDVRYRVSFWTGNEEDDLAVASAGGPDPGASARRELRRLTEVSPAQANLELNLFGAGEDREPARPTPRDFISILLGGRTNAWSNVEFAASFATVVSGRPIMARITSAPSSEIAARAEIPGIAERLRPGLEAVVRGGGTADRVFRGSRALELVDSLGDVDAYAKTGTLEERDAVVSRFCIALVRWEDEAAGIIDRGLVLSIAAEEGPAGSATEWTRDFLEENEALVREFFESSDS